MNGLAIRQGSTVHVHVVHKFLWKLLKLNLKKMSCLIINGFNFSGLPTSCSILKTSTRHFNLCSRF